MKRFIGFILAVLVVVGCSDKASKVSSIENTNTEKTENEVAEETTDEKDGSFENKDGTEKTEKNEKKYLETVLYSASKDDLIERQTEFTDFSTKLPIGDKIVIERDSCVSSNVSAFNMKKEYVDIKADSEVYLLTNATPAVSEAGKEMIEFSDDNGNHGWIGAHFLQKKYTADDSIIKKQWVKEDYDFACFSPDNKLVAFHRFDYSHGDEKGVLIADRETGEEIFSYDATPDSRISYAFSPDGKYFYFVLDDNTLCQLSIETGEFSRLTKKSDTSILGIYPLDDCENIVLALYTGWALYNREKNSISIVPSDDFMWANDFTFSKGSPQLIAGSATNPRGVCVWDKATHNIWQKYDDDYCGELLFSDNAKILNIINHKGITSIDAGNGCEIDKNRIHFPYQLVVADYEVNEEKDRVVYALNERESSTLVKEELKRSGSYIFVYDLGTGKLVQAEQIYDEGKKIEDIALSPDGEYISIRIKDGSHVTECHQVICKIDLDKKACELPKIEKSNEEEKAFNFLLDNTFDLGYWSLNFFYDGTYTISGRHDGIKTGGYQLYEEHGNYYVKFSGCGYNFSEEEFEISHKDLFGGEWETSFSGKYLLRPDYVDFNVIGAFTYTDDAEIAIPSRKQSPSGMEYDYLFKTTGTFEKVYKYPTWRENGQMSLYIKENTKMRDEPFLDANEVYMSHYDYDTGVYTESRCVLFAGSTHRLVGRTVRKDKIGGVEAPWYLVWESNGGDGPDQEARLVWVFGGFSEVYDPER